MTDILIFIGTIFCLIGFISYFFHCYIFAYIGAILIFIGYLMDYFSGKIKNISYLVIITIIGILFSINFKLHYFNVNLFMCIICIDVIVTYIIAFFYKQKSTNKIANEPKIYYYSEYCIEFQKLINYWNEKGIYNNSFRIKEVKDYKNLKTCTAKIIFLFNLILDLNEFYAEYRIYIGTTQVIDYNFINQCELKLRIYKDKLKAFNEILDDLDNESFVETYKLKLNIIYHNFADIFDILIQLHDNVNNQTMHGTRNSIDFNILNPLIQKLETISNALSDNLIEFQKIINENDTKFTNRKIADIYEYMENK